MVANDLRTTGLTTRFELPFPLAAAYQMVLAQHRPGLQYANWFRFTEGTVRFLAMVATADASALATGFRRAEPGENACIVAHDGPIRAILNHYLGVPPEKWWTLSTTHGAVSLLEYSGDWVNVRFVNAASHLAGLEPDVYVPSVEEPAPEPEKPGAGAG